MKRTVSLTMVRFTHPTRTGWCAYSTTTAVP
jgi:hypothetical protein